MANVDLQEQQRALEDYQRDLRPMAYSDAAIDRIIISNSVSANKIVRKIPYFVRKPIFALDEFGEKIPLTDSKGNVLVNENGEIRYIIKDYEEQQVGFTFSVDTCQSSEFYSPDMTSTYLTEEMRDFVMQMGWIYNYYQRLQMNSRADYSYKLHKLCNDVNALIVPQKSYNGGSVSAVKTFRSISDGKQVSLETNKPKRGGVGGIIDQVLGEKKTSLQSSPRAQGRPFYMYD